MRILFLTQWFQPEPFFKGLPFAKKLKALGHEVEVLTGFPNYPDGMVYQGYRVRLYQRETMDGIPVHRVALFPSHDRSGLKRMLNYLSFGFFASLLGPWVVKKPDVVYVYNLITLAWAALCLKMRYRCKIIYDVQDLWPDSVTKSGMMGNELLLRALHQWCKWAYRQADKIAVLSPGFKKTLIERGVSEDRIDVIYNWADESNPTGCGCDEVFAARWGLTETFNVVFAGTMGRLQGLDTVLDSAKLCLDDTPEIRFVLIGGGTEVKRLKLSAKERGLHNVVFVPRLPMEEMGKIWPLAHVLLVHLVDDPLFRITIPSKTQAYLTTGIPVLMAVNGDAADLIKESGAGVVCPPESPFELMCAIKTLFHMPAEAREEMGRKGMEYYTRRMSAEIGCSKFLALFNGCQEYKGETVAGC